MILRNRSLQLAGVFALFLGSAAYAAPTLPKKDTVVAPCSRKYWIVRNSRVIIG